MRGTSQRSTAEGSLTSMLLTRSLTASIQRIPLSTSGTRMLTFLPMSSPALCLSSYFLFLPIEDGETTLVKHMTVPILCFTHTSLFFFIFFFFTDSLCYYPRKSPKKSQKKFNLKKIHFDNSLFNIHLFFSFFYQKISKIPKKVKSQKKFTSIVQYIQTCHILFAIRALPTDGKANRPRASYY